MSASSAPAVTILLALGLLVAGPALALESSVRTVQAAGDAWSDRFPDVDGSGVVVAVLDTGVDDEHGTFAGAFVTGVDLSSSLIRREDPACSNPDDGDGHGTHVAGILLGRGVDGRNRGVAPGASLVDVKVATDFGAAVDGLTRGLEWVQRYNAGETACHDEDAPRIHVVSVSMGTRGPGDPESGLSKAAQALVDSGVVVVAAAGNCGPGAKEAGLVNNPMCSRTGDNTVTAPAVARGVLAVASYDDRGTPEREDDGISLTSSRGPMSSSAPKPDVAAPGVAIESASGSRVGSAGTGWTTKSGTSMAAPHVAGVAALVLQVVPDASPADVRAVVTGNTDDRGPDGWDPGWGHGAVSALRAVATVAERPLSPPVAAFQFTCEKLECAFDGSTSTHPEGLPLESFSWRFNDGTPRDAVPGKRVTHAFPAEGAFTVTLTVKDADGRQGTAAREVVVALPPPPPAEPDVDDPPRAVAEVAPSQGPPGTVFEFNASGSTDAEGNVTTLTWDVGDDGTVDAEGWSFTWTDAPAGVHPVTLTVTDSAGQSAKKTVTVLVDASLGRGETSPDVTPPRVEFAAPSAGVIVESPVKVQWDAWDAVRVTRYVVELDGRVVDEPRSTMTLVRADPGEHRLVVRAWDAAGNEGVAETTFIVPGAADEDAPAEDAVRELRVGAPQDAAAGKNGSARGATSEVPGATGALTLLVPLLSGLVWSGHRRGHRKR